MKTLKRTLALAAFGLVVALAPALAEDNGILLQLGIGYGPTSYSGDIGINDYLDQFNSRTKIALDLQIGLGLSPDGYLIGALYGVGDRGTTGGNWVQYNTYLWALGFRFYPVEEGLYVQGMAGYGDVSASDSAGNTGDFDGGLGFGGAIGYDFGGRGLGLTLEAAVFHTEVTDTYSEQDEGITAGSITANIRYR